MATVSAVVYDHHKKKDGTYNVKIRIYHKGVRRLIDTSHYVSQKQLDTKLNIKDKFVLNILDETLLKYRRVISEIADKLDLFAVDDLRNYLLGNEKEIDFIEFCDFYIDQLRKEDRNGSANNHRTVRNSLVDYFQKESVLINEINTNMLNKYMLFLKSDRRLTRVNQLKKEVTTTRTGLSRSGLFNHLRDLKTLFNAAVKYYNNDDFGVYRIKHNPFKNLKVDSPPITRKRNISIEQIKIIQNCKPKNGSRAELAKDLFMLSFYMCGMNAVDIYSLDSNRINEGRLEYNRSKTTRMRRDDAFISVKIIPEAKPLLEKYIDILNEKYATHTGLDEALSMGMKDLRGLTGIPELTFYWARHTFATLARNKCRLSMNDVALALNHVDANHKTTDIYIDKDWTIVDEVQERVVGLLI
ncbi:MAG: site-specific integrase [Bacteroidota bacterium]|nr:site-specific integrase [Bacteroidota bacterium]